MSKKSVVKLLVRLYGDPTHLAKFRKNPAKTLKKAGLSPTERKLVLSGDAARLRAYLGAAAKRVNIPSKATGAIKEKTKAGRAKKKARVAAIKEPTKVAKRKTRVAAIKKPTKVAKGAPGVALIKESNKVAKSAPRVARIKKSTKIDSPSPEIAAIQESTQIKPPDDSGPGDTLA